MRRISFNKIFWGILLIIGAVLLITDASGVIKTDGITPFNIIFGVILLACFINSIIKLSFTGMMFSLAFLCILFSDLLHLGKITPWPVLLAATLGSIGLNLIFPKRKTVYYKRTYVDTDYAKKNNTVEGKVVEESTEDGDIINITSSFGGGTKYLDSKNLKTVNIKCRFTGMDIYFDKAQVPGGTLTVNIDSSFSGIKLYIPDNWNINNTISNTAGVVNMDGNKGGDGPVVVIKGTINCGGIDII